MVVPDDEGELLSVRLLAEEKLYGRDRELRQLHKAYQRLCQRSSSSIVSNGTTTKSLTNTVRAILDNSSSTALRSVSETEVPQQQEQQKTTVAMTDDSSTVSGAAVAGGALTPKHPSSFTSEEQKKEEAKLEKKQSFASEDANSNLPQSDSNNNNQQDVPDPPESNGSEAILITGASGTGKTALVYKFIDELEALQQVQEEYYHDHPNAMYMHAAHRPRGTTTVLTHSTTMSSIQGDVTSSGFVPDRRVPNLPCFFLSGKFEDQRDNPYSAFVEAFSGFCSTMMQEQRHGLYDPAFRQIRHEIQQAVGNEGKVLTDLIPDLVEVIGEQPQSSQSATKETALHRLKYVFKNFLMVIGKPDRPIVLFLDDLQWADGASLDLIETILKDTSIQHLLFIGSYRLGKDSGVTTKSRDKKIKEQSSSIITISDDEVTISKPERNSDTSHPTGSSGSTKLHNNSLLSSLHTTKPNLEYIHLGNLSKETIRQYLWDTLDLPAEETDQLTHVLHSKTQGNIFFTVQSLEKLHRRNILTYSQTAKQWDLDLDELVRYTKQEGKGRMWVSDTVVDVVLDKLQSLPAQLQQVLTVAAYIRSTFDIETLHDILHTEMDYQQSLNNPDESSAPPIVDIPSLVKMLDTAVVQGLLKNTMGSSDYSFAHDRIQEASLSLIESDERNAMRVRIGKKLISLSKERGEDWMLFVAADHFHAIKPFPYEYLVPAETAQLNLQAGEMAVSICAFDPASKYLRQGLECLRLIQPPGSSPLDMSPPSAEKIKKGIPKEWAPSVFSWHSHYDMTLRLYCTAAEIEFVLGNHDFGMKLSEEIFRHAKCLGDMLPTYSAVANSFGRLSRHDEGMEWNLKALNRLGHFPKRFHTLYIMVDLRFVRMAFRRYTDYDILLLPKLADSSLLATMEILSKMSLRAWFCRDKSLFLMCVLRQLRISFRHGICGHTAHALACYGSVLAGEFGDEEGSMRMGRLARQVIEECDAKFMEAVCYTIICGFIEGTQILIALIVFRAMFSFLHFLRRC